MRFLGRDWTVAIWNGQRLNQIIAIDTETTRIVGHAVPDLITFQVTDYDSNRVFFVKKEDLPRFFNLHTSCRLVFHNAAFDLEVICKAYESLRIKFPVFDWLESGEVYDTGILYRLFMLASLGTVPHRYNLALLANEFLSVELDKDENVRLTFDQYYSNGITYYDEISAEHLEYAAKDVIITYALYRNLMTRINKFHSKSDLSQSLQVAGDFVLNRMSRRGIGVDLAARNAMLEPLNAQIRLQAEILATYGWVQGSIGVQERYEWIVDKFLNLNLPRTEDGRISSKAEDLEKFSHIPFIKAFLEYQRIHTIINFLNPLNAERIHPQFGLLKTTGRTSCEKPNLQNIPRVGGVRELFVPKPGHKFFIVDYSFLELCTLAQTCYSRYGFSRLRDIINSGRDPHKSFAADVVKRDESTITKDERQFAKAANFGFPGGLGIASFLVYARETYGVNMTFDEASDLRKNWFLSIPEMKLYMDDTTRSPWTLTGRVRGNADYCASKNTPFQGLAADGNKLALFNLEKAGFKPLIFIHDEIICEEPERNHKARFEQMKQIMIDSMRLVTPDVNIKVEGHILDRWEKR